MASNSAANKGETRSSIELIERLEKIAVGECACDNLPWAQSCEKLKGTRCKVSAARAGLNEVFAILKETEHEIEVSANNQDQAGQL